MYVAMVFWQNVINMSQWIFDVPEMCLCSSQSLHSAGPLRPNRRGAQSGSLLRAGRRRRQRGLLVRPAADAVGRQVCRAAE